MSVYAEPRKIRSRRKLYPLRAPPPVALAPIEAVDLAEIIFPHLVPIDFIAAFAGRRGPVLHIAGSPS
jgi:hypothetical protein